MRFFHIHKYLRHPHTISFRHAWDGISHAFKTQPNFQFHVFAFIITISAGFLLGIGRLDYIVIIVVSSIVFSMEMLNTALEALGDEVAHEEYRDLIKIAKDVASGGVLISVVFAIIAGAVIFIPYLL